MKNIVVCYGGDSTERDISIITALQVFNNIDDRLYKVIPVFYSGGEFFTSKNYKNIEYYVNFKRKTRQKVRFENGKLFYSLLKKPIKIDCVLNCCHGGRGENGALQGFFDVANIPYTSAGVLPSSICMDKVRSKECFKMLGLNVVDYIAFDDLTSDDMIISTVENMLGYPVIVKPNDLGSSIGISVAKDKKSLRDALIVAKEFTNKIIVEKALRDFDEYNCAGLLTDIDFFVSEVEKPKVSCDFLTFENKYLSSKNTNPSYLGAPNMKSSVENYEKLEKSIKKATEKIVKNLGIYGVCRCDFLYSDGKLYVNEVNTIPGSLAYYLFKKQFNFASLLNMMIESAISVFNKNKRINTTFRTEVLKTYHKNFKSGLIKLRK